MAEQATSWLPLERIKQELRLPSQATDQDVMLVGHIEAAIGFVETEVGIPLLDKTEIRPVAGSGGDVPLQIGFVPFLQSVPRIDYWDQASRYEQPDGNLEQAFETRALLGTNPNSWKKSYLLLPPSNGFPVSSIGLYHVTIQYGMNPGDFPNITQLLIVLVREFYSGSPQVRTIFSRPMFERLLEPLYPLGVSDYGPFSH